ncbi:MAG: N-6 DNA methylase, partial [Planctomycetota bacterium]
MIRRIPSTPPKPRVPSDEAFLAEVESYWATVAAELARRERTLPLPEVQCRARRVVELSVFLGMCHGRGLLPGQGLATLFGGNGAEPRLHELLGSAEERLGTGLFRTPSENEPSDAPETGPSPLDVDAETSLAAASRFLRPGSKLDVAARPVEILGRIHERLLGKRLVPGRGGRLRVASGPEARKKGGVFYTPDCVARYLVENGLDRRGPSIPRILDPACGSGSLLLAACRRLLARRREHGSSDAARLVATHLYGVDADPEAVLAARRTLWLEMTARRPAALGLAKCLTESIRFGNALGDSLPEAWAGRFDAVIGNPPYRRELNAKDALDRIAATELGRRHRAPRMDLWYYFVHRSLDWLKPGGRLSFIVGSYWTSGRGAEKLIRALRTGAHVEEIFLLDRLRVFPHVAGRHMIFRLTTGAGSGPTTIKRAAASGPGDAEPFLSGAAPVVVFRKTAEQLFRAGRIDVEPPCDVLLAKLSRGTPLAALGRVRQGIAENPATVTPKTQARHGGPWTPGEGVFAPTPAEVDRLNLSERETRLVHPYHDLCDLGRYFLAQSPSRRLIYSTRQTWPEVDRHPRLRDHLGRYRPIMEARRETRRGARPWWQLHWPREESLWRSAKIVSVQMAARPAFVAATEPVYVPFSANVFVPQPGVREHLYYLTAVLNSR